MVAAVRLRAPKLCDQTTQYAPAEYGRSQPSDRAAAYIACISPHASIAHHLWGSLTKEGQFVIKGKRKREFRERQRAKRSQGPDCSTRTRKE
jgi:hypothetical protein